MVFDDENFLKEEHKQELENIVGNNQQAKIQKQLLIDEYNKNIDQLNDERVSIYMFF